MPKEKKHQHTKNNSEDGYSIVIDNVIKNPARQEVQTLPFEEEYERITNRSPELYGFDTNAFSNDFNNFELPKNGAVIDNNDYITLPFMPKPDTSRKNVSNVLNQKPAEEPENISSEYEKTLPEIGEYILIVKGKIIFIGSLYDVEETSKSIIYGDDINHQNISSDDLMILKRVSLKIGVFIEE